MSYVKVNRKSRLVILLMRGEETNLLFCKKVSKKLLIYVKVNRKSRLVFLLVRWRNQPSFLKKSRQKTFELGLIIIFRLVILLMRGEETNLVF